MSVSGSSVLPLPQPYTENPYGLTIIHQPTDGPPCADIVLVHGLGGHSQDTWKWSRRPHCFWPELISNIPPFGRARILTFGYRAPGPKSLSRKSMAEIADFALDLLFHLRDGIQDVSDCYQPLTERAGCKWPEIIFWYASDPHNICSSFHGRDSSSSYSWSFHEICSLYSNYRAPY